MIFQNAPIYPHPSTGYGTLLTVMAVERATATRRVSFIRKPGLRQVLAESVFDFEECSYSNPQRWDTLWWTNIAMENHHV